MYHIFCSHSSVEGHLGSSQLLAIINKAAMDIVGWVMMFCAGIETLTQTGDVDKNGGK